MSGGLSVHGGRLAEARSRFGGAREDWLDLSTGINPVAWSGGATADIDWRSLPDPGDLARLERQAARYFGVDPALCCAVPGSETGLRLIARILGGRGLHLPLAYSTHADAFEHADPVASLAQLPAAPGTLVIANPNNPDGVLRATEALLNLLERQESGSGWLIVDEAFADCRPEHSIAGHVASGRRLIVLRSFGKFFGLAGVRLGFVVAPTELLGQLRRRLGEWPVSAAALAFGTEAYGDAGWIAATRRTLPEQASRLDAVLKRHGLAPRGECPLFRLVETSEAGALFIRLAQRHILIRPFADHSRLLRFGLPNGDAALGRLDAALAHG
ncbi:threonine-phosphate decarboxylase [Novosphingobium endophyticum]|uniref:threonine-phosphate decarboxylase n=1 Tax=Novosphingobium endophyticum TaxID=1955250 RepID=A0A916TS33_9SPHN|nr:threonine-phosphate decarboxylase CobD [Novosphingobium endophyticum]GGB98905.1 threonine-phosphate decarboxylase [Novosphingobium endophyticum]